MWSVLYPPVKKLKKYLLNANCVLSKKGGGKNTLTYKTLIMKRIDIQAMSAATLYLSKNYRSILAIFLSNSTSLLYATQSTA